MQLPYHATEIVAGKVVTRNLMGKVVANLSFHYQILSNEFPVKPTFENLDSDIEKLKTSRRQNVLFSWGSTTFRNPY